MTHSAPTHTEPSSARRRALIVSGAREDRGRLESLLARKQIVPLSASAAEPAIALLSSQAVDLVICDIMLRGRPEGIDIGRWLRRHLPQTALILMSDSFPWITANSPLAGVPILVRPLDETTVETKIALALSSAGKGLANRAA